MRENDVLTQTVAVSQARQKLGELVNEVYKRHVRVIVEKSGIPVVALVALSDLERWQRLEREKMAIDASGKGPVEMATDNERTISKTPARDELDRRKRLATKIVQLREEAEIAPLTTADLIHQVRGEELQKYGNNP